MTDVRSANPDKTQHRRAQFQIGWQKAAEGRVYTEETLKRLTWNNLGWRLGNTCGAILGAASEEQIREMYAWCVRQQAESGTSIADE